VIKYREICFYERYNLEKQMIIECIIMIDSRTRGSPSQTSQSTQSKESLLESSVLSALTPSAIVSSPSPPLCTKAVSSPSSFYTSIDTCSGTSFCLVIFIVQQ